MFFIFISLLFLVVFAHDKCVLRLEDIDMPTFVIDLDRDIATNITIISQDNATINETACDLSDPEFFQSLTLAYNISNLDSVLAYARFVDSLNITATHATLENMIAFTHKSVVTSGELSTFVADILEANFNTTETYTSTDVLYHLLIITLRALANVNVVIHNSSLAELDKIVYRGWDQMPHNMLTDNEIYRGIIARKSVNNTLFDDSIYEQPYTAFDEFADYLSSTICRSQRFDKYGFRRATLYEMFSAAAFSGELAKFKYQAKMLVTQRLASLPPVPLKSALWNGISAGLSKLYEMDIIIRPSLREFGGLSRRFRSALTTITRAFPATVGIMSRAWYDKDVFRFSPTQRSMQNYETLISSVQRLGSSSSIQAAAEHNLIVNNLWKTMFLPASSLDAATQTPELFELSDIFSVRYWWDPAGSWSGFAPTDRKVLRMSGLFIFPIPADMISLSLWIIKYFGRSTVLQGVFNYFGIVNPFGNSTNSPFGVTNETLCLPAPGWFWILPDPDHGCQPPQFGPAPVVFESTDAFMDYTVSMLISNWTKYDPWLNPFDKIPAVLQLLTTSLLNETVFNNPSLGTVISWIEIGVNVFWTPLGLMPFKILNQNMPKYAWLTLMWVVPAGVVALVLVALLGYGTCVGYCIPQIGIIIGLGDPAVTVSGGLAAQVKFAANLAFQKSLDGIKQSTTKASADLKKYKDEQAEKRQRKQEAKRQEQARALEMERQRNQRQAIAPKKTSEKKL